MERGAIEVAPRADGGRLPVVGDLEDAADSVRLEVAEERGDEAGSEGKRARKVRRAAVAVQQRAEGGRSETVVAEDDAAAVGLLAIEVIHPLGCARVGRGLGGRQLARLLAVLRSQRGRERQPACGAEILQREVATAVARPGVLAVAVRRGVEKVHADPEWPGVPPEDD